MVILAILGCHADPPTEPPATREGHVFEPVPADPAGVYSLTAIIRRHEPNATLSVESTLVVDLHIDDGGASFCTTSTMSDRCGGENPERRGYSGTWALDGPELRIELTGSSIGCDVPDATTIVPYPESILCTLGELDGRNALACAPSRVLGGDSAALAVGIGAPLVVLGRPHLLATRTDRSVVNADPDWTLLW